MTREKRYENSTRFYQTLMLKQRAIIVKERGEKAVFILHQPADNIWLPKSGMISISKGMCHSYNPDWLPCARRGLVAQARVHGCLVRTEVEPSALTRGRHPCQRRPTGSNALEKPPGNRSHSRGATLCAYVVPESELQRLMGQTRVTCAREVPRQPYPSRKARLLGQAGLTRLVPLWMNLWSGQYWTRQ